MNEEFQLTDDQLQERRQRVFLVLAGIFLGTLAMLHILGVTRFLDLSFAVWGIRIPFTLAVGVLPYPITFLCADFISELYGRRRANFVVWVGLLLNLWVVFILWLGGLLPGYEQLDPLSGQVQPDTAGRLPVFFEVRKLAFGAVIASMMAYISAQFCNVYLFHFWKDLTRGKHLWLRNNGSTLISQLIDTVVVIAITHFYAGALPVDPAQPIWPQLWVLMASGYGFKLVAALADTLPFYLGVRYLVRYLRLQPASGEISHPEQTTGN